MCCRTNDNAATADVCATRPECIGLFVWRNQDFWRESCTDRRFQSEGCVRMCMDDYGA
jgi:hypothetical protein